MVYVFPLLCTPQVRVHLSFGLVCTRMYLLILPPLYTSALYLYTSAWDMCVHLRWLVESLAMRRALRGGWWLAPFADNDALAERSKAVAQGAI